MIHDILLSLLNPHLKNLPIEEFLITDSVSVFLHPGEKKILEDIVEIINLHKEIIKFTKFYRSNLNSNSPNVDPDETLQKSLYLQAFANGIDIVLENYLEEIAELEKRYLQSPSHSLLFIYHKVNVFQPLFIFFQKLIRGIKYQKLHGCAIIQYLHQNMLHGNQQIYLAMKTIQSTVNIVLLKHLTHWLLYAKMIDNYGEFFIQYSEVQNNNQTLESEKCTSTGSGKNTYGSFSEGASTYADIWRYEICYEYLPHYLSPALAEKILFIGQTVLMFKMDAAQRKVQIWNESEKRAIEEGSLWNNQEHLFFQKIQNLQNDKSTTLNISDFEKLVDEIKSYITERLSQIAVNQADLVQQLKLIKDFYMLGRGELFLEFIKKTYCLSKTGATENTIRDIVKAFESAAHGVGVSEELEQFTLTIPKDRIDESNNESIKSFAYMQNLQLQYKINWPLHLLFSPKVIERYNELFRFLLQVKRLQYDLHMIWCLHRDNKLACSNLITVMHLRNQFMFIMDNLQYYIQADVLESQFSILMSTVQTSTDFEEIQRAHSIFQANVLSLCFLLGQDNFDKSSDTLPIENSVLKILNEIFLTCEDFCNLAKTKQIGSNDQIENYQILEHQLIKLVEQLINMLFSLKSAPSSTPLSQLLLRLDFNHWFSNRGHQLAKEMEKQQ